MPKRAIRALFCAFMLACSSPEAGPDAAASPDASETARIETDAYRISARGELASNSGTPYTVEQRLLVYVAGDTPLYVRDEGFGFLHGRIYDLRFEAGAEESDAVHLDGKPECALRIRRDGCATFEYDDCFRPAPWTDTGPVLTGTFSGCPNDEHTPLILDLGGTLVPRALLPDGRARLYANFRLDATRDAIEFEVNGESHEASFSIDSDPDSGSVSLGSVPPNATLVVRYVGTREQVDFAHVEPFRTTAIVSDGELDVVDEGAFDARGATLEHEAGALAIRRGGSAPHPAFAYAVALGEPPTGATALETDLTSNLESDPLRFLVRADGSYTAARRRAPIDLPDGEGAVWLVVAHPGVVSPDGGPNGDVVLNRIAWQ